MKNSNGFTSMTVSEFAQWLPAQKVTRGITRIQMHHTAAPNYATWNKFPNPLQLQKNMRDFHVNSCGWADIAQQFTICPDGTIVTGRSLNKAPAGIAGANSGAICIENIGNFDKGGDTMTQAQADAIVAVVALLLKRFGLTADHITYHAWWTASGGSLGTYVPGKSCKTCPGTNFFGGNTREAFNRNFRTKVVNYMANGAKIKIEEYTDIEAIAWDLNHRGIVDDKQGLINAVKAEPNGRLYWLARKTLQYIRERD
ncbi:MAG: N-acetylmuramoyl-L-alanine amidase [Clostridia bacterium]|nr:N-acetylmuramoyl-L-alanine amidase [Clostridia bacterium]